MTTRSFTLLSASASLALALGCAASPARAPQDSAAVSVQVVAASAQEVGQPFDSGGVVRANIVATVTSHIMAQVRAVQVAPGDRVKAGQVLVVLDGRDLQANRARAVAGEAGARQGSVMAEADRQAAAAGLELAALTHKRMSDLRAKNSATPNELDQATAGLRAAESRLKAADARVAAAKLEVDAAVAGASAAGTVADWATLTAPFDGVVTEKQVEVGNMVGPGQPLVTIEDTRGFRVETRLDESRAAMVHVGDPVGVSLSVPGQSAEAALDTRVTEIARMVSADSHDFLVKIELPSSTGLRSGIYGHVRFAGPKRAALTVPATALVRRGQLSFVFVVERDNRAHLRLVNAGDPLAGLVEIRSGLVAGDRVVNTPPPALTDGSAVTTGGR